VFLVKPSKYDDQGYVVRHCRGVLPSNTLACLYGLTEDVRQRGLLGDVDIRIHIVDEAVQKVPLRRMTRMNQTSGDRVVVCRVRVIYARNSRSTTGACRHDGFSNFWRISVNRLAR